MLTPHTLIAILLLCAVGTKAQDTIAEPSSTVLQSCLMGTHDDTWAALKLTRDQLTRMKRVQEACGEECDLNGVKKKDNPISNADGNTVMAEVRNILTRDQYRAWVDYCGGKPIGGAPPK